MNRRLTACFVRSFRWAASFAFALGIAAPAMAQWKTNPSVESRYADGNEVPYSVEDRCRLELDGTTLTIQRVREWNGFNSQCGLKIHRLNRKGLELMPDRWFVDPAYPNASMGCGHDISQVVGCKVSQFDFMLAYRIDIYTNTVDSVLRVVRLHWNDVLDQYQIVAGFPVTISFLPATGLSITPNDTGGGTIDGVLVAWQLQRTPTVVEVYQQGVLGNTATKLWPQIPPDNGQMVDSYPGALSAATQPTSVVSTGDSMAVTTYHKLVAGNLLHWTAKWQLGGDPNHFPPLAVPGQATNSESRCVVASDGGGGAFYGFATDAATITELKVAQVIPNGFGAGAGSFQSFWTSQDPPGSPNSTTTTPTPLLRALSFLPMPAQSALLVYRDRDGIRCIKWETGLNQLWTRFVRGATLTANDDDAATAMNNGIACVVTTSDADVQAKGFTEGGDPAFPDSPDRWVNDPNTTNPPKSVAPYRPRWPHAWATGGASNPGFMLGWFELDQEVAWGGSGNEYWLAERITKTGQLGKWFYTGVPGSNYSPASAVAFDIISADPIRLEEWSFDLGDPAGLSGFLRIYTAVGMSHVGIAGGGPAWTLAGGGAVVSAGPGELSTLTLSTPIELPAGTNAILVRGQGLSLGSTAATGSNLTLAVDDLTVQCGAQVVPWPFGPVQTGRVFQGGFSYEDATIPVVAAVNLAHGTGCYGQSDSFYSYFPDAAAAATALSGQSMQLTPNGTTYQVTWGGGTFVPPSVAVPLTFAPNGDDGVASYTLSGPFNSGVTLYVHSNGNVWFGDNASSLLPNDYTPRASGMLNAPHAGFWSWHDYNVDEPGSGQVYVEEDSFGVYVTWMNVESYPLGVANPSTMQIQINPIGGVTFVWPSIDGNTASPYGSGHLVGYSPAGPSVDGGNVTLPTGLPLQLTEGMLPLDLTATTAPVLGTTMTYATSNMPEAAPGFYVGALILSLTPSPGIELSFLGAPGCNLYVGSLDLLLTMVGTSPTQMVTFPIPNGPFAGMLLHAQSVALFPPGSLPNGLNAFGATTSNGLQSRLGN